MATATKKLYEGMFLVDTAVAAADWKDVTGRIETILKRVGAEIISLRKWDDRKLAYDFKKISRGTYILTYFRCEGEGISEIEKAVRLSEQIMRVLILNAEHMTQEDIEKETPATQIEREKEEREAAAKERAEEKEAAEEATAKAESAAGTEVEKQAEPEAEATKDAAESGDEASAAESKDEQAEASADETTPEEPKTAE